MSERMRIRAVVQCFCLIMLLALTASVPVATDRTVVVNATPRVGAEQRVLILWPDGPPKASVVLYAGGKGGIGIRKDGSIKRAGNFLVRSRDIFAKQGFLVAVPNRPSDWAGSNPFHYRLTEAHAADAAALIRFLRQLADVPVWLVGTSRGSISAANNAARLGRDGPDGIVLTSSVVEPGEKVRPTVQDADLERVTVPTLILGHEDDGCYVTLWDDQMALARLFENAPAVETIVVSGGNAGDLSRECGPYAHHGFLGVEDRVVARIADWIQSQSPR